MKSDEFSDVQTVIREPLKFKLKLAIGEDAYTTLRLKNKVSEMWDVCGAFGTGATLANSTLIATTFFAPKGLLAFVGLGTAVTPVGWVVAAALLSGGAYVGVRRVLSATTNSRTDVIPKFINTPVDVLAISLFDLIAPLALKIAKTDGDVTDAERMWIKDYFVNEWGYDPSFIEAGSKLIESRVDEFALKGVAERLAELSKTSPDCNYEAMTRGLIEFLRGVAEADCKLDEREELALEAIEAIFKEAGRTLSKANVKKFNEILKGGIKRGGAAIGDGIGTVAKTVRKGSDSVINFKPIGRALNGIEKGMGRGKDVAVSTIKQAKTISRKIVS